MNYYNQIYDILSNKGEEYATAYPEINEKNVYSISSLAWPSAKQVYWKMINKEKAESKYLSLAMTRGRAIHEFLQKRLSSRGFVSEYPISYQTEKYKLIGHIDSVNFRTRDILEFKSTVSEGGERFPQWIVQLGAYCKALEIETGFKFSGQVFCLNEFTKTLNMKEITNEDIELSWKIILERAEETWRKINE